MSQNSPAIMFQPATVKEKREIIKGDKKVDTTASLHFIHAPLLQDRSDIATNCFEDCGNLGSPEESFQRTEITEVKC